LSLVHVELSSHGLHLRGLLFKVLLVDGELFSNLWTRLSSEKVFELNIELFLLSNDDVLLDDFLSLLDESLLKSLNLVEHLPSIWVSTLKLSPSVTIERILKFFRKSLDLESLGEKLLLKIVDFLSEVWDLRSLRLDDSELRFVVTNLELEQSNVLKSLLVLNLSSEESTLKNLDLLIKKSKLIISSNELGTKNISLIDYILVVLLEPLDILISILDDQGQI